MTLRGAPIVGLLLPCGPATIAWVVGAIIVFAVERSPVRALAHVSKKIVERLPAIADRNPAPAIEFKPIALRIQATLLHARPGMVSRRKLFASLRARMAMLGPCYGLVSLTSAACCVPTFQVVTNCNDLCSTIAQAFPARIGSLRMRKTKYDQPPEALSGQILEGAHV